MIALVRAGLAILASILDDDIDTSPEARRAANQIQPSGSTDPQIGDDGDMPAPVTLSPRQAKTRAAVERLISAKLT